MSKKLGISKSEFARRCGVSRALVNQKIRSGHLTAFPDDTLDPALVGTPWHAGATTLEERAKALTDKAASIPAKAESEAVKEYFLSQLRRLEYEEKNGKLAPLSEMEEAVKLAFARVRARMLALPARAAPLVEGASAKDAFRVLQDLVHEALSDLASTKTRDWYEQGGHLETAATAIAPPQ